MNARESNEIRLERLRACAEAVEWSKRFPDLESAWAVCERGDWMLWLLGRTINCGPGPWSKGRRLLLDCALDCAETVKRLWPEGQADMIRAHIAVLRAWIHGRTGVEEAKKARIDLWNTANAAANAAIYAAAIYAAAAVANPTNAARLTKLKECADIVRRHYPSPPEF